MSVLLIDQIKELKEVEERFLFPYSWLPQREKLHWLDSAHAEAATAERSWDL